MNNRRCLAVGDIHGCHTALKTLLEFVDPRKEDQMVFLGDYIDRGPGTRQVIDRLLKLSEITSPVFIRGNHELMMLETRHHESSDSSWLSCWGLETLDSYGASTGPGWAKSIPESHWHFLETTVRYFETSSHIFVHACVEPEVEMAGQTDEFLCWEYFENLRPHRSGRRVVCGHTPQRLGRIGDKGYGVCIDTGAIYDGWLSCLDVESNRYWQANELGATRAGRLEKG